MSKLRGRVVNGKKERERERGVFELGVKNIHYLETRKVRFTFSISFLLGFNLFLTSFLDFQSARLLFDFQLFFSFSIIIIYVSFKNFHVFICPNE